MFLELKDYKLLESKPHHHAYLDEAATLKASAWLLESDAFDYTAFIELCNLLEAIVLYDRLYTCPIKSLTHPPNVDLTSPSLRLLVEEGVLIYLGSPIGYLTRDGNNPAVSPKYRKDLSVFEKSKRDTVVHVEYLNGVGMASVFGMHIHPSHANSSGYLELLKIPSAMSATTALLQAYAQMSKSVSSDIESIIKARGNTFIEVPPIALEIFKRVDSFREVLEETLYLRENFRSVREAYSDYAQIINDSTVPLRKSLSAQTKLKKVLTELSKPFEEQERRKILEWSSVANIVESAPDLASGNPAGLASVILGKPLEWIVHKLSRRQFMQLYKLRDSALKTRRYEALIDKIWGHAAKLAGDPPKNLTQLKAYPEGADWPVYSFDNLCLWSWEGIWAGYTKYGNFFSPEDQHLGRIIDNIVYDLSGSYLGEIRHGRILHAAENETKKADAIAACDPPGARPAYRGRIPPWPLPNGSTDFSMA
jgi:hypothetical protein